MDLTRRLQWVFYFIFEYFFLFSFEKIKKKIENRKSITKFILAPRKKKETMPSMGCTKELPKTKSKLNNNRLQIAWIFVRFFFFLFREFHPLHNNDRSSHTRSMYDFDKPDTRAHSNLCAFHLFSLNLIASFNEHKSDTLYVYAASVLRCTANPWPLSILCEIYAIKHIRRSSFTRKKEKKNNSNVETRIAGDTSRESKKN